MLASYNTVDSQEPDQKDNQDDNIRSIGLGGNGMILMQGLYGLPELPEAVQTKSCSKIDETKQ